MVLMRVVEIVQRRAGWVGYSARQGKVEEGMWV